MSHTGGISKRTMQKTGTEVIDINQTKEYENLSIDRTEEHTRAYLKVQDGCNQFCTYCIIPYARGRMRSRKDSGCGRGSTTPCGIRLSGSGTYRDPSEFLRNRLPGGIRRNLLTLIQAVHEVEGIERIRLGSLEPRNHHRRICSGDFSSLPKVCPHFHLSLQSGCDSDPEAI